MIGVGGRETWQSGIVQCIMTTGTLPRTAALAASSSWEQNPVGGGAKIPSAVGTSPSPATEASSMRTMTCAGPRILQARELLFGA